MLAGPYEVTVGDYPDTDADIDIGLLSGLILDVGLEPTFSGGSSMDVAITTKGQAVPTVKTVLSKTGITGEGWYCPREQIHNTSGAAISSQYNAGIAVHDVLNIAVSKAGAGDKLKVWFLMLS